MSASSESTNPANPDAEEIESGLKQLNGRDRLGKAGELVGVAGGVAAGATAAGSIAGAIGATTLLGSHGLATVLGGVLVTSTPIGWVIGCAVVGGAAAYGAVRLARSGGHQDARRDRLAEALATRLRRIRKRQTGADCSNLDANVGRAIDLGAISAAEGERLRILVAQGKLDPETAAKRLHLVLQASKAIPPGVT